LSDPEKRKKYDQYGKDWEHAEDPDSHRDERASQQRAQHGGSTRQRYGGTDSEPDFSDFSGFFESMFGAGSGGGRRSQVKFRGEDIHAELHLDLKDVYQTHKRTLTVNDKEIRLTIPAGVENGQTIKIKGYGGEGVNGGPNGDLFITFSIANPTRFKRDGNNLHTTVDLDLYTAMLGGELTIDTFDGKVKVPVKAETQHGTKVKLKGKGFPVYKKENQFGDLYITYQIKVPTGLSDKEKELFKELSKLRNDGN
jgi:curved DNA-binding protein